MLTETTTGDPKGGRGGVLRGVAIAAALLGAAQTVHGQTALWIAPDDGVARSYSNPANWDIGAVPCNSGPVVFDVEIPASLFPGDRWVVQDVPGSCTVSQLLLGAGSWLDIDPGSTLTAATGAGIGGIVFGVGGNLSAPTGAVFAGNEAGASALAGSQIAIAAQAYSSAGLWSVNCPLQPCYFELFAADGAASVLDLSSLQTIDAAFDDLDGVLNPNIHEIAASGGGLIDLSALTAVTAPVQPDGSIDFHFFDPTSTILLPSLSEILRSGPTPAGSGKVRFIMDQGGELRLGELQTVTAETAFTLGVSSRIVAPGTLNLPAAVTATGPEGAVITVGQDYSFAHVDVTRLNLGAVVMHFVGGGEQRVEVGGADQGVGALTVAAGQAGAGATVAPAAVGSNFGFGQLIVGQDIAHPTTVRLQDLVDNDGAGQGICAAPEALYLYGLSSDVAGRGQNGLFIHGNSTLVLDGIPVYAMVDGASVRLDTLIPQGAAGVPFGQESGWLAKGSAKDDDGDGVANHLDNCVNTANADQRDTNNDGYGNRCDADLNNDGIVNTLDFGLFRQAFGRTGSGLDADFNGDGLINTLDFGLFRQMFGGSPGPSCAVP